MEFTLKEVEVTKLNLQPGEILAITIKSDDVDSSVLEAFRKSMKPAFPNNEVLIIAVSTQEDVRFSSIIPSQTSGCGTTDQSYCSDCSCGKKEQVETKSYGVVKGAIG